MTIVRYLIVRSDGDTRIVTRRPGLQRSLAYNEVAFKINVVIPDTWGKTQPGELTLTMPEPPEALLSIVEDGTP